MSLWYKNIHAFKLVNTIKESELSELKEIVEGSASEITKTGWSSMMDNGSLYEKVSDSFMFQLQVDKKNIPGSLVKEQVKKEIKKQKDNGIEKPNKKEIKENIVRRLAEKAFFKPSFIRGYIDNENKLLIVDSTSNNSIDLFVEHLRRDIESLKIELLESELDIGDLLTQWVTDKAAPEPFQIEDTCTLTEIASGSSTTYKKQDLSSEEIEENLKNGKRVSSLKLNWHERFSLTINNEFKIKGIKSYETVSDQLSEEIGEEDNSEETLFIASMSIMIGDFAELMADLIKLDK
jgi:recombination associated protein RdgC